MGDEEWAVVEGEGRMRGMRNGQSWKVREDEGGGGGGGGRVILNATNVRSIV